LPVRVAPGADGSPAAWPEPANTSGDLAGLAGTDGFLELPAGETEFPAGYTAPFFPW
jgi:molybdopterin molybdotransferase